MPISSMRHLMPFSHRGGVQNLENNTNRLSFESVQDYDDWLARMDKVDEYIEQTIALAEVGRKQGYMPPKILMQRIPDQIAVQLVDDAEDSPFFALFERCRTPFPTTNKGACVRLRGTASRIQSCLPIANSIATSRTLTCPPARQHRLVVAAERQCLV